MHEAVGEEWADGGRVEELLPHVLAELEHPALRLRAGDVKAGVHLQASLVPGVEVVPVVHGLHAPDETERHLHAHVALRLLLEAKVLLVQEVISERKGDKFLSLFAS